MVARSENEQRGSGLSARGKTVLFFLALVVRLLALVELDGSPWNEILLGDARFFDEWGQRIAAGDWLGDNAFYQAPLYPYFLGGLYALLGHVPGVVRILQCLLGALAAVWIGTGTTRFASRGAGLAAGIFAALYAPLVWYDLQIEKSSFACSITAGLFLLVVTRDEQRPGGRPFWAGVLLGLLALLRENAAILFVPLVWALGRERSGRGLRVGLLLAGLALVLSPVALCNRVQGGAFLPTGSNAGVNLYIGNGAEADGMYRPLIAGRGHPDHEREDAQRIAQDLSGEVLSPAQVSWFWFRLTWREVAAEPGHFLWLLARKTRLLANHGEIMDASAFEVFEDESWILRMLAPLSFGALLALALAGAVVAWGRQHAQWTLGAAGWLALSILAFFVVGRFRLGLVPLLLPFAGIALAEGLSSPRRRAAAGACLAGALLAFWPLDLAGDPRASSASNLASELTRRGQFAAAEPWARAARERDPLSADAAFNLGLVLRKLGRETEAEEPFEAAMELEPSYASDCLAELGAILASSGDLTGARERLRRALALDPGHQVAREYLRRLDHGSSE